MFQVSSFLAQTGAITDGGQKYARKKGCCTMSQGAVRAKAGKVYPAVLVRQKTRFPRLASKPTGNGQEPDNQKWADALTTVLFVGSKRGIQIRYAAEVGEYILIKVDGFRYCPASGAGHIVPLAQMPEGSGKCAECQKVV